MLVINHENCKFDFQFSWLMIIDRHLTTRILEDSTFFPAVAIIGPRQVGKTTLARSLQSQLSKPSLFLDLESDSDRQKLEDAETYLKAHAEKCVIIDEIQLKPELFSLLRHLIDIRREPMRFLLLGSASPDLIRKTSDSLAGRIAYHELAPLSLLEIENSDKNWQKHWFRGGFPDAYLAPTGTMNQRWLGNFVQTFVERDLRALSYNFNSNTILSLLRMLSHLHGGILNTSDLSRSLDLTHPTVKSYIDVLEGGFIINRLLPYFVNVGKRLTKSPKIYIRDSGILHSLARINQFELLQENPLLGASWEGYVIEQIKRVAGTEWEYYFYRTHNGAEIDLLLIAPNGKKVAIEIKYSNAPVVSRGFYECNEDIKPDFKYVIIPTGDGYIKNHSVKIINLYEFLAVELKVILA